MNGFIEEIRRRQRAGFGGIKVVTRDEHNAQKQIREALRGDMLVWSVASGIWKLSEDNELSPENEGMKDVFETIGGLKDTLLKCTESTTIALFDLDTFLEDDASLRRHIVEAVQIARNCGHLLLLVSCYEQVHVEMQDHLSVLRHELPDRDATRTELVAMLAKQSVQTDDVESAINAVQGLTSSRQMDAMSLGVVDALLAQRADHAPTATLDVNVLRRYKEAEIGKLDYLKVSEPTKTFDDLVGHEYLKVWLRQRRLGFQPDAIEAGLSTPRGVLLVGPPGTGKTRLAEAFAADSGIPFLQLDMGSVFGGVLGQSEAQVTHAMEIAERMAPCVLLVDEVEGSFGKSGGDLDGGTTDRVISKFLTWMALKTSPVFLIFTSNNARDLPAQMIRSGRIDEKFFVDFPTAEERRAVFQYYLAKAPHAVPDAAVDKLAARCADWSPAEIEAVIGSARFVAFADERRKMTVEDVESEMSKTVPVAMSMEAQVKDMRDWASSYARRTYYAAAKPYSGSAKAPATSRKIEV